METFCSERQDLHIAILAALQYELLARGILMNLLTPCSENVSGVCLNYYPPIVSIFLVLTQLQRY
jgi:hypothetical protein